MKKLLKWAAVIFAAVFALPFGRLLAAAVKKQIPLTATWATPKFLVWLDDAVTFTTGLVAAVLTTKITAKLHFFGKGGGVTVSK